MSTCDKCRKYVNVMDALTTTGTDCYCEKCFEIEKIHPLKRLLNNFDYLIDSARVKLTLDDSLEGPTIEQLRMAANFTWGE